jgi:hypothetical protein
MNGACTFVPHSRFPYARKAGRWPHGEGMMHEAIAEICVPPLNALFDLKNEGYEPRRTIGRTPGLAGTVVCPPPSWITVDLTEADPGIGSDQELSVWQPQLRDVNRCGRIWQ